MRLVRNLRHCRVSTSALSWALGRFQSERPLAFCLRRVLLLFIIVGSFMMVRSTQRIVIEGSEVFVVDIPELALSLPFLLL